ncbi:MAG: hypothetical protein SNJ72_09935, partial [Fimbriimonadales bacterium]
VVPLGALSLHQRALLVGARVISPSLLAGLPEQWVLLNADWSEVAVLNEEDHLRLQITCAGWQPEVLSRALIRWEQALETFPVRWGYLPKLGYLTASPINLGAGLRLGLLLHLMGLQRSRQITRWLEALQALGCHARGLYGEGSLALEGYVQVSLVGGREPLPDLLARLRGTLRTLIQAEREARLQLHRESLEAEWSELSATLQHSQSLSLGTTLRALAVYRMLGMATQNEAQVEVADRLLFRLAVYPPPEPEGASIERAQWIRSALWSR